jgi:NO-binding membrane sensor protein with MHYT domain
MGDGVSLIAAMAISALAFHIVARNPRSIGRLLLAGSMLGLGAVVMHYLGMYGMRFGGHLEWDHERVAMSVLIALVAATAALWLAFHTAQTSMRLLAAAIMALAVCAMHYTGMSAAEFICTTENRLAIPSGRYVLSALGLPMVVAVLALGMSMVLLMDWRWYLSKRAAQEQASLANELRQQTGAPCYGAYFALRHHQSRPVSLAHVAR